MDDKYIVDFFGNEIRVGDKVICSNQHAALCFGEVVRIGNTGRTVDIKIIYAPFEGYWKEAPTRIGKIKKNVPVIVDKEENRYYTVDNQHKQDVLITSYSYCIKYDFPTNKKQYKILETK